MTKRSYPNLLEWIGLATSLEHNSAALQAVHVTNGGRRIEATNRYAIHAAELIEPDLQDGLYYFSSEFGRVRVDTEEAFSYPNLQHLCFQEKSRDSLILIEDRERELHAYMRAAEGFEKEVSMGTPLGVVRIGEQFFQARLLLPILAGLCFTNARHRKFVKGVLRVGFYRSRYVSFSREFEGHTRLASLASVVISGSKAMGGQKNFDCTDFFEPVTL